MLVDFELAARDLGLLEWDDWDEHFVLGRRWAANSIGFKLFCQYVCGYIPSLDYYVAWKHGLLYDEIPPSRLFDEAIVACPDHNPKVFHSPRCDTVPLAA